MPVDLSASGWEFATTLSAGYVWRDDGGPGSNLDVGTFAGSGAVLSATTTESSFATDSPISMGGLIRFNGDPAQIVGTVVGISGGGAGNHIAALFRLESDSNNMYMYQGSGTSNQSLGVAIGNDVWTHVVVTSDGLLDRDEYKIYINGTLQNTVSGFATPVTTGTVRIGSVDPGTGTTWTMYGDARNVFISTSELNVDQIGELYEESLVV
jgi:hypothetical protein